MRNELEKMLSEKYEWWACFSEGLARVRADGKWGFINRTGKEITPLKYDAESCDSPKSR